MKIFLNTIGCRLNQSEIESMSAQFRAAGHIIVAAAQEADVVVVNTCAVTAAAASDSRQAIRQASRAGGARILATGCWATLEPDKAALLPAVDKVVLNGQKDDLVASFLHLDPKTLNPKERQAVPGDRSKTRAFIKVQDGCNNACTFCITHIARGRSTSRLLDEVINDVNLALDGGAQEVILTGVHLGSWGKDFHQPGHLTQLVEAILKQTRVKRLRLSSLEPWDLDPSFFSLWSDPRLCPHFHFPLQSGSKNILKRMARKTTPGDFLSLVAKTRELVPDAAITTDIIVGFPGETSLEFEESLSFIQNIKFSAGHIFHFSPRPGTPAAAFPDQVNKDDIKQRSVRVRALFEEMAVPFRQQFIGRNMDVLWESAVKLDRDKWQMEGWTPNYIRVKAMADFNLWNQISTVALTEHFPEGLIGNIIGG